MPLLLLCCSFASDIDGIGTTPPAVPLRPAPRPRRRGESAMQCDASRCAVLQQSDHDYTFLPAVHTVHCMRRGWIIRQARGDVNARRHVVPRDKRDPESRHWTVVARKEGETSSPASYVVRRADQNRAAQSQSSVALSSAQVRKENLPGTTFGKDRRESCSSGESGRRQRCAGPDHGELVSKEAPKCDYSCCCRVGSVARLWFHVVPGKGQLRLRIWPEICRETARSPHYSTAIVTRQFSKEQYPRPY